MTKAKEISVELVAPAAAPAHMSDQDAADQIIALHTNSGRAAYQQIGYAFLTGQALNRRKESLPHGQFLKWCQKHLEPRGLKERTARRYMAFAEALQPRLLAVPAASSVLLQLTDGQNLREEQIAAFSEAIREVANGQSLTDLYRDYGIVKDKVHQKDRDNRAGEKQTPEEIEAARKALALEFLSRLTADLGTFNADPQLQADLDTKDLKQLRDELLSVGRTLKDLIKSRTATRKPQKPQRHRGAEKKKGK